MEPPRPVRPCSRSWQRTHQGHRPLSVRVDSEAPGGYRIEGRWIVELPVNDETPAETKPDRRFRVLVAGARSDRLHTQLCRLVVQIKIRG